MILSDTVKMKEFQEDPEMLLDLMQENLNFHIFDHRAVLSLTLLICYF